MNSEPLSLKKMEINLVLREFAYLLDKITRSSYLFHKISIQVYL